MDVTGSDKSCGFCYRGKGILSLGGVSPKALERFLSERKDIESVFIVAANDEAGNNAAEKLLEVIPEKITVIRFLPEAKDWNEDLVN